MPRLRHALLPLALLVCAPWLRAETPTIDYVAWYYKNQNTFKRIAEYFGGGERTARKVILRTDASERGGLYFVCRIEGGSLSDYPTGSEFALEVIFPDSPREKTFTYKLPDPTPEYEEIWLGVTGKDEPENEEPPIAWRILVKSPDGTVLTTKQSYLWSIEEPAS